MDRLKVRSTEHDVGMAADIFRGSAMASKARPPRNRYPSRAWKELHRLDRSAG
jgi:hypothetical protein